MKDKFYIIEIIILVILSICGIYNFLNPIKNLNLEDKIIKEGTILQITKEYEYNENSEYVEKYVAQVLNNEEQYSINLKKEDALKYKEKDKVNFFEQSGEFYITHEKATPTNGGFGWILLSVCEILGIFLIIKYR
ncbi:MAG: hypothetical protein J6J60_05180 [Clostridia bacterium]|nr:hypothetical protein [Clostridia bacterium]